MGGGQISPFQKVPYKGRGHAADRQAESEGEVNCAAAGRLRIGSYGQLDLHCQRTAVLRPYSGRQARLAAKLTGLAVHL